MGGALGSSVAGSFGHAVEATAARAGVGDEGGGLGEEM